jgi:hypothetical protein
MAKWAERPEFPERQRDEEAHDDYVGLLIARLRDLEDETHPAGGDRTAQGKDQRAFAALGYAGDLVRAVAGWALDHQHGLAIAGLHPVLRASSNVYKLPEYVEAKARVDDHEHERVGGAARAEEGRRGDTKTSRRHLINLLLANPGSLDRHVVLEAVEALRALDHGEVLPLLSKEKKGLHHGYRELYLQLRAVSFVEYRVRRFGTKKFKAQSDVAEAYGVSADTLRSWEKRLRDKLGYLEVARAVSFARNMAANAVETAKAKLDGAVTWDASYSDEALEKEAARYKSIARETPKITRFGAN